MSAWLELLALSFSWTKARDGWRSPMRIPWCRQTGLPSNSLWMRTLFAEQWEARTGQRMANTLNCCAGTFHRPISTLMRTAMFMVPTWVSPPMPIFARVDFASLHAARTLIWSGH